MNHEKLLGIGAFAEATTLSPKAPRHKRSSRLAGEAVPTQGSS
ncbi:hypothetical protein [Paeniglutamicibacter sp.]